MHNLQLKKLIINSLLIFSFFVQPVFAQNKFLQHIKPDQLNLQYAGSIGFISGSIGYHFLKEKTTLSFHYGYVPESLGGELSILAAKFQYRPWAIKIKDKFIIYPFNPVIFPSYTLGENFDFNFKRSTYRRGYYFWSSALRIHLGAGTEIKILNLSDRKIKSVSIYAETNTNDLYALTWFKNRTSSPFYAMFKLGYGVKMDF